MIIENSGKLTARQAAEKWVDEHFPERTIGKWNAHKDYGATFQLADGIKWYDIGLAPSGWEINEAQ